MENREVHNNQDPHVSPGKLLVREAQYADIARRVLQGTTIKDVADAVGLSDRQVSLMLRDPRMREVFEQVKMDIYGGVDKIIQDELVETTLRRKAVAERGITLLGEVMQAASDHMRANPKGSSRSGHLDAAVKAVRAAHDMAMADVTPAGGSGGASVQVFNMPGAAASIVTGTADEVGIPVDQLFGGEDVVDAEVIDEDAVSVDSGGIGDLGRKKE